MQSKIKYGNTFASNIKKLSLRKINVLNVYILRTFGQETFRYRNPYNVLGLHHSCSTQDIKKAYIKLCKEMHPDKKPGDATQHRKFVELNEAYTTLVNLERRREFDNHFTGFSNYRTGKSFLWRMKKNYNNPFEESAFEHERPWYEKKEYEDYLYRRTFQSKTKEVPHPKQSFILVGCVLLLGIGSLLYAVAYRFATIYFLQHVDEKSRRISEKYDVLRRNALESGKEKQLEMLKKRWNC